MSDVKKYYMASWETKEGKIFWRAERTKEDFDSFLKELKTRDNFKEILHQTKEPMTFLDYHQFCCKEEREANEKGI